jgi:hypothetical protein
MFELSSPEMKTNIRRVVGGSDDDKRRAWDIHQSKVEHIRSTIFEGERDLSEEELSMLRRSEDNVNMMRKRVGLPPIVITSKDIRAINKKHVVIEGETISEGGHSAMMQTAFLSDASQFSEGVVRFDFIQHECVHIGQYQDMQFRTREGIITNYKSGLAVEALRPDDSGEYGSYLHPLNEAVTEENARRFTLAIPENDPELGHIARKRNEAFRSFLQFCKENPRHGYPQTVLDGDMLTMEFDKKTGGLKVSPFMYYYARQAMWHLFEKIYDKNPKHFQGKTRKESKEDMFETVTACMMTGNLIPFGRLMNEAFGLETFRSFGRITTVEEFTAFVEKLS